MLFAFAGEKKRKAGGGGGCGMGNDRCGRGTAECIDVFFRPGAAQGDGMSRTEPKLTLPRIRLLAMGGTITGAQLANAPQRFP